MTPEDFDNPDDNSYFAQATELLRTLNLPFCLTPADAPREEKLKAIRGMMNAYARAMAIGTLKVANVPLGERLDPNAPFNFVTARILAAANEATKSCTPKKAN